MTESSSDQDQGEKLLFWEDLPVGFSYRTSSRTVTEADVVAFAALTGDFNRIHVDAEFAAASPFRRRIAHGLLIVSWLAGLNTRTIVNQRLEHALIGLLETRCRFIAPTFIGDTVHGRIDVIEARPTSRSDRGLIVFRRCAVTQREEVTVECQVTLLMQRRPLS